MSEQTLATIDKPQSTNASPSPDPGAAQNGPKRPTCADVPIPDDPDPTQHSGPTTQDSNLSQRQLAALELMLLGQTDSSISQQLCIGRRTLYRWKTHDPAFIHELSRRRDALYGQSTDRLRLLLDSAMDTLEKQVKDKWNPTSHRAASTILRLSRIGYHLCPKLPPLPIQNRKSPAADD